MIGDGDGGDEAIEPYQQQQQQQQQEEENRVYLAYDGLTSSYTKNTYRYSFDNFIKITVKNDNLRVLLEPKQSIVEYKLISHIKYLNEVQQLGYLSIQTHLSGILRFFAMNDYHLNIKKIRRFLPSNITDRSYSVTEIEKILSKCDGRDGRLRTIVFQIRLFCLYDTFLQKKYYIVYIINLEYNYRTILNANRRMVVSHLSSWLHAQMCYEF